MIFSDTNVSWNVVSFCKRKVNFYSNSGVNSQTFICNRYFNVRTYIAECQIEIVEDTRSIKMTNKKKKDLKIKNKINVAQEIKANINFTGFASCIYLFSIQKKLPLKFSLVFLQEA